MAIFRQIDHEAEIECTFSVTHDAGDRTGKRLERDPELERTARTAHTLHRGVLLKPRRADRRQGILPQNGQGEIVRLTDQ